MFNDISLKLDSSISNHQMSDEEFREYIYNRVQGVLQRYFPNSPQRQRIKKHKDYIQFACPLCGDSAYDDTKKRGFILYSDKFKYLYKCWNCREAMNLNAFFSKVKDDGMSLEAIDYMGKNKKNVVQSYTQNVSHTKQLLFDIDYIESVSISREEFMNKMMLVECNGTFAEKYLHNRCLFDFSRFLYNIPNNQLFLLNLTPGGKIFGYQVRNLNPVAGAKYLSYNIENIDRLMHSGQTTIDKLDEYNQLSMVFNILLVDFTKPIIVTEGPIDSFFINNGIAMCGAAKKLPLDLDFYYMYDCDETGKKYAMDDITKNKKVFLWDKFMKDYNLPKRKKWDWNDVVKYFNGKLQKVPNIIQYFSNDVSDMFYI